MKKLEQYIERPASAITGKKNLEHLYTLQDFPVFMGCVDASQDGDLIADMVWDICKDTGIIQLRNLIPLEVLYLNQHNEGIGKVWTEHYLEFCKFLKKYDPHSVLEIGGAHGLIAKNFIEVSPDTSWVIVEPNPTFAGNEKIKVIRNWFDDKFSLGERVDTVVHSHVLEHTYDPVSYLNHVSSFLRNGDRHIFTFPNMREQLVRKYTNCLNFEHTVFLTEYFVDYLLERFGFKILEKQYFQDHSIFYATEKLDVVTDITLISKYDEYKKLFMEFAGYHLNMVKELNEKINSSNLPVYLFGAHIFSQYLLGFGLDTDKIVSVLDNSPTKQGKRLYGTRFKVESPKVLAGKGPVNIILKAGIYNEEIKKDILENINEKVEFW